MTNEELKEIDSIFDDSAFELLRVKLDNNDFFSGYWAIRAKGTAPITFILEMKDIEDFESQKDAIFEARIALQNEIFRYSFWPETTKYQNLYSFKTSRSGSDQFYINFLYLKGKEFYFIGKTKLGKRQRGTVGDKTKGKIQPITDEEKLSLEKIWNFIKDLTDNTLEGYNHTQKFKAVFTKLSYARNLQQIQLFSEGGDSFSNEYASVEQRISYCAFHTPTYIPLYEEIEKQVFDVMEKNGYNKNSELNVLSIGCGPATDYWGWKGIAKNKNFKLKYTGIDLNDWNQWNPSVTKNCFGFPHTLNLLDPIENAEFYMGQTEGNLLQYVKNHKDDISKFDVIHFPISFKEIHKASDELRNALTTLTNLASNKTYFLISDVCKTIQYDLLIDRIVNVFGNEKFKYFSQCHRGNEARIPEEDKVVFNQKTEQSEEKLKNFRYRGFLLQKDEDLKETLSDFAYIGNMLWIYADFKNQKWNLCNTTDLDTTTTSDIPF